MTTPVVKDRVMETSITSGTGPYTLAGAVPGFQSFDAVGDGNECYYAATDSTNWEIGIGTYAAGARTLTRTSVTESSNNGNPINWPGTQRLIYVAPPASIFSLLVNGSTGSGSLVLANGPAIDLSAATGLTANAVQAALASLPATLPASSGQLWWNGGVLSLS